MQCRNYDIRHQRKCVAILLALFAAEEKWSFLQRTLFSRCKTRSNISIIGNLWFMMRFCSYIKFWKQAVADASLPLASYARVCSSKDLLILFTKACTLQSYILPFASSFCDRIEHLFRHPKCLDEKHCGADGAFLLGVLSDRMMECDIHHAHQHHLWWTCVLVGYFLYYVSRNLIDTFANTVSRPMKSVSYHGWRMGPFGFNMCISNYGNRLWIYLSSQNSRGTIKLHKARTEWSFFSIHFHATYKGWHPVLPAIAQ
jgi:hypothetical protein